MADFRQILEQYVQNNAKKSIKQWFEVDSEDAHSQEIFPISYQKEWKLLSENESVLKPFVWTNAFKRLLDIFDNQIGKWEMDWDEGDASKVNDP